MHTRFYVVTEYELGDTPPSIVAEHLVDASSGPTAVSHIVQPRFKSAVATQRDIARLMEKGIKLQVATKQANEPT